MTMWFRRLFFAAAIAAAAISPAAAQCVGAVIGNSQALSGCLPLAEGQLAVGKGTTAQPAASTTLDAALYSFPNNHIAVGTTAPALTSCGSGSPAIIGDDKAGQVTMGTSATGCVITFATAYVSAPFCVVDWIATPLASQSYAVTNTAITLTQTSTSGNKAIYFCLSQSGG
jgi:hypothetical protein